MRFIGFSHPPIIHPSLARSLAGGHSQMTSVERGREGDGQFSDQRMGGCVDLVLTRGEGVQKSKKFVDVICTEWCKKILECLNFPPDSNPLT